MNKILVINNKIKDVYLDELMISNNTIKFMQNGDYEIEYLDCDEVKLVINVDKNVFVKLFEYSNNHDIKINNTYNLLENANLLLYKFEANDNTLENLVFNLEESNAKLNYNFSSIASLKDIYKISINHNSSNTFSNVVNRSIAKDDASIDFTIDSNLPKGKEKCYLNQDTKIITFGKNNSVIRPNMFIEELDVEARHASAIGRFSLDDIFYLMARGIKYDEAIKLLIKGLIFSNLVANLEQRERIFNIISANWR